MNSWNVYIVECADGSLYTGVTNNVQRRILEHNYSIKAAKYTRSRRPVKLVYRKQFKDRSSAQKEEYRIKKLSRKQKLELINNPDT